VRPRNKYWVVASDVKAVAERCSMKIVKSLFNRFQRNEISTQDFCETYERIWNFEFDKRSLSEDEFNALDYPL
jgi:hypothetical protein